jgi:hypothetical protein
MLNNPIIIVMPQRLPITCVIHLNLLIRMNITIITIHITLIPIRVTSLIATII